MLYGDAELAIEVQSTGMMLATAELNDNPISPILSYHEIRGVNAERSNCHPSSTTGAEQS